MINLRTAALLGAALIAPLTFTTQVLSAETHAAVRYHDGAHNDDHEWNNHEDRAYRMWAKENHRKYTPFTRLREDDRQSYWGWRHDHDDSVLKINIR